MTQKCEICGVGSYSRRCRMCGRRLCSQCIRDGMCPPCWEKSTGKNKQKKGGDLLISQSPPHFIPDSPYSPHSAVDSIPPFNPRNCTPVVTPPPYLGACSYQDCILPSFPSPTMTTTLSIIEQSYTESMFLIQSDQVDTWTEGFSSDSGVHISCTWSSTSEERRKSPA